MRRGEMKNRVENQAYQSGKPSFEEKTRFSGEEDLAREEETGFNPN